MRMSLLRSPKWPDPTADRGKHSIEYALYPHQGTWHNAMTVQRGFEFNNPLIATATDARKGTYGDAHSFAVFATGNVVLTTLKKCEDEDAYLIQWYNLGDSDTSTTITLPKKPKKVVTSNFLEVSGSPVETNGNVIRFNTAKRSVVSLKAYF